MQDFNLSLIEYLVNDVELYTTPVGNKFLDDRYQHQIEQFGHPTEYYRLFYHIAKFLQPQCCVELGGWQGTAAAHLAGGYPKGTVITIDHHSDPGDDAHRHKMIEATKAFPNLIYLQGWTWDVVGDVQLYAPIDILFIDSWHHYDKAMKDWELYSPMLADTALVICDDLLQGAHEEEPIYKMMDFWDELEGEKYLTKDVHSGIPMGFLKVIGKQ